ncbi:MAG: FUSC family membrane protein [Ottowia sp.]|uniref:FUSC family protein n=1 Tax=Ottowia sp. TaxID=1898956 RepID=UPI0039E59C48
MNAPAPPRWWSGARRRQALRTLLSAQVLNGASVAFGMFLVTALVHAALGAEAAANATVGVITALVTDGVRARRGKFAQMVAAPLLGIPLFLAVQLLRHHPVELGLLLVPATFVAFLGMAWGKRGMPVAVGVMLAMLFALSPPPPGSLHEALMRTLYCALGAVLYIVYAVLANLALNGRYRAQLMADLLLSVAALLRTHAGRIAQAAASDTDDVGASQLGELLQRQAALADQLQATRDVVLESPRTPRRQRLAGMLIVVLEMRDHLIASELDLGRAGPARAAVLDQLAGIYRAMARDVEQVADALLLERRPPPAPDHGAGLAALRHQAETEAQDAPHDAHAHALAALLRSISFHVGQQDAAVRRLTALARGDAAPDLAAVRTSWQLFVSPAYWSWQPLLTVWHWRQPALRHALRAALAVGTGYLIAMLLPWGSHDYWILITIVVVLRGNLAQTLERLNDRVAGTLVGSLLATGLLALHPPALVLLLVVTIGQGVAHAFAVRHYMTTAVAASVMGLVQAHLLYATGNPTFALVERVGDTLLGAGIAWAFCYVLPSWERHQLADLVRRVCLALALHARHSLAIGTLGDIAAQPELAWRLARREAYDALSALVQAAGRALAEPRAVRPPLAPLELLQGHGYQLLGQLSAVQSLLLLRREHLQPGDIAEPVHDAAARIEATLDLDHAGTGNPVATAAEGIEADLPAMAEALPDPFLPDAAPWLLRRLRLAEGLANDVRQDAQRVLADLAAPPAEGP